VIPALVEKLESLVDPTSRGDPMSPLRWTCKSTRNLSDELAQGGVKISHTTVAQTLHGLGYSLQGNKKAEEGNQHPDRNAQFEFINRSVQGELDDDNPVISVDTKKKELVGNYKNNGRNWLKRGTAPGSTGMTFPTRKSHGRSPTESTTSVETKVWWWSAPITTLLPSQ